MRPILERSELRAGTERGFNGLKEQLMGLPLGQRLPQQLCSKIGSRGHEALIFSAKAALLVEQLQHRLHAGRHRHGDSEQRLFAAFERLQLNGALLDRLT